MKKTVVRPAVGFDPHAPLDPLDRILLSIATFAAQMLLTAGVAYLTWGEVIEIIDSTRARQTLIVFTSYISQVPFAMAGLLICSIYLLAHIFIVQILSRPSARIMLLVEKWVGLTLVPCVLLMLSGGLLINPFWHSYFERAGYERCTNTVFLLSKSFIHSAWVRDAEWCQDPQLARILRKEHSERGFQRAADYLRRTYVVRASRPDL